MRRSKRPRDGRSRSRGGRGLCREHLRPWHRGAFRRSARPGWFTTTAANSSPRPMRDTTWSSSMWSICSTTGQPRPYTRGSSTNCCIVDFDRAGSWSCRGSSSRSSTTRPMPPWPARFVQSSPRCIATAFTSRRSSPAGAFWSPVIGFRRCIGRPTRSTGRSERPRSAGAWFEHLNGDFLRGCFSLLQGNAIPAPCLPGPILEDNVPFIPPSGYRRYRRDGDGVSGFGPKRGEFKGTRLERILNRRKQRKQSGLLSHASDFLCCLFVS